MFRMFAHSWAAAGFGGAFTLLLVFAIAWDLRHRRIPNALVIATISLGLAFALSSLGAKRGAAVAAEGMAVGLALWLPWWWFGMMGAGDVKFFAAAAAWLGPGGAWRAALVAALAGGVLSLGALIWQRRTREGVERVAMSLSMFSLAPLGKVSADEQRKAYLPYGVALACGALLIGWIPGILSY